MTRREGAATRQKKKKKGENLKILPIGDEKVQRRPRLEVVQGEVTKKRSSKEGKKRPLINELKQA